MGKEKGLAPKATSLALSDSKGPATRAGTLTSTATAEKEAKEQSEKGT